MGLAGCTPKDEEIYKAVPSTRATVNNSNSRKRDRDTIGSAKS